MNAQALAPLADVARLAEDDGESGPVLQRLVRYAMKLVPNCAGAALTISVPDGGFTAATTSELVDRCHVVQFDSGGRGPARETLERNEPRRVDDVDVEDRWPEFCATARAVGFLSCLALPLRTDRLPSAALNLYSAEPGTFAASTHDVALLFAMQGSVALDNADLYRHSCQLVEQLHRALESRGLIERAKGLLMGRYGMSSSEAYEVLRRRSQKQHLKLRDVAAALLRQSDPEWEAGTTTPWTPVRDRPRW